MKKINEIIVVEGTSDKQFLETFIKADILTCNGSAIDGFDIDYLKELAKNRGVIILTDPDYPGMRIRDILQNKIGNCKHAFVDKKDAIKHHKVGVAEASKENVLNALNNVVTFNDDNKVGTLTLKDMLDLNLASENSSKNKEIIENTFHIGKCNTKTMIKRLNLLGVSKEKLKEVLYDSK